MFLDQSNELFLRPYFSIMSARRTLTIFFFLIIFKISAIAESGSIVAKPMVEPPEKIPPASDTLNFEFSAAFQSRHVWRGTLTCKAWNIQPTFNVSRKNFLIGTWAAYTIDNSYAEFDLYLSYTVGSFSVAILDYFCPDENQQFNRLFDFKQPTTKHTIDAILTFNGTNNFPLQIMASTLIYGDDLEPNSGKNYFSTYVEANYSLERTPIQRFDFFIGVTPYKGYYANSFNIVNAGFSIEQNLIITENFQIPVFGKLHLNPFKESIHFVFGLSINV